MTEQTKNPIEFEWFKPNPNISYQMFTYSFWPLETNEEKKVLEDRVLAQAVAMENERTTVTVSKDEDVITIFLKIKKQ